MSAAATWSMPCPPEGFAACRVGYSPQVTHLVILDSTGSNGGRPTMCRLTRFPTRGKEGETLLEADLPGWSMGGGVSGPGVEQVECPACYERLTPPTAEPAPTPAPVAGGEATDG